MISKGPDYKRIYSDIIKIKHPGKKDVCKAILAKNKLSALDIIELNRRIFGTNNRSSRIISQKHRSYNKLDILEILNYQQKNFLNDSELAVHFQLSRNTIAKWKKLF